MTKTASSAEAVFLISVKVFTSFFAAALAA